MCIIVYKPFGSPVPNIATLENCFENNSDGAGFAWYNSEEKLWYVEKGFMKWKKFKAAFLSHNFTENSAVIAHFRIGTCGLKDKGNTHPFPVVSDMGAMRETKYKCEGIAFHNGVVGRGEGDYSDSMVYVRNFVLPLWGYLGEFRIAEIMEDCLTRGTSKWIVTKQNDIWVMGSFIEFEGCKYSNTSYEKRSIQTWKASTYEYPYINKYTAPMGNPSRKQLIDNERISGGVVDGVVVFTPASKKLLDNDYNAVICPSCFEDKYIDNSPYNVGDSICLSCGAVFMDSTGHIIMHDLNVSRTNKGEVSQLRHKSRLTPEERQRIIDAEFNPVGMM